MRTEKIFNGKKIILTQGDITNSETDAIVNAANNHLWMGSGVAGAIKSKGGVEIEKEAIAKGPIEVGDAVATTAGKLKAKFVIHAAVMGQDSKTNEDYIRNVTLNSLKEAEKLKLSSIAFPALGTGVGGFPISDCAKAMINTTAGFFRDNQHIKEAYFVLFNENDYNVCALVLEEVWNCFQWNLKRIEDKQKLFRFQSRGIFGNYYKLLNESEEILIQTWNLSRAFCSINKDRNFNQTFCMLGSYVVENAEAIKEILYNGLFTSSSILLRNVYTCRLTIKFLRVFPERIDEWLEESKKGLFATGKELSKTFKESNMRDKLEKKGEKTGYELFTVLSKAMHGSTIWSSKCKDLSLFISLSPESISTCKAFNEALLLTLSRLLCGIMGEFLGKYQSEIKTNDDLKNLKFRYDELFKKTGNFYNKWSK